MMRTRRPLERLRQAVNRFATDPRRRRASVPILCSGCGRGDDLVRVALGGGSDEIRSVYSCARPGCRSSIRVIVGIGLAPRIVIEDVSDELEREQMAHGAAGGVQAVVGGDGE